MHRACGSSERGDGRMRRDCAKLKDVWTSCEDRKDEAW